MMRAVLFILFLLQSVVFSAQGFQFVVHTTPEICQKGNATFQVTGHHDSLYYEWSTGEVNQPAITGLKAGDYWIRSYVMRKQDTVSVVKDTTLQFTIEKELCPLFIPKYFSPNGDGYNDLFIIGNIENFPEFELIIFNKWGQRVHYQKDTFTPWDGRWLGTNLADGTYYYVLFYNKNNESEFLKDDLTILR